MTYTEDDVKLLAKCAYLEDAREGICNCYLVMHTIVNRVGAPDFPKTLYEVIHQPNAYSWTRPDNPEHGKEPPNDATYQACLVDAPFVLEGDSDPTRGAKYYFNPETADKGGWFERHISGPDLMGLSGHEFTMQSGKHRFYR